MLITFYVRNAFQYTSEEVQAPLEELVLNQKWKALRAALFADDSKANDPVARFSQRRLAPRSPETIENQ